MFKSILFLFIGIVFASNAYTIPKGPCDQPKDICCKEPADSFAFAYPKDVGLACPQNFYMHGEFLWMKPSEEGLEYAIKQDSTGTTYQFPLQTGKIYGFSTDSEEWEWRPGFRIGLGCLLKPDCWDFELNWTYFRMKSDSTAEGGHVGTLLALLYPGGRSSQIIPLASARWSGDFNTFDISIGKSYHVSRFYVSNLLIGLRFAWIDQDYHVRYFQAQQVKENVFLKNDYWGAGLRGFYQGDFILGGNFTAYGKVAFSILYGKFDISQHRYSGTPYDVEHAFYCVKPNAEIGVGMTWGKFFHKEQYRIALNVGYEFHHWWDQNQLRRFFSPDPVSNDTISRGDLAFNGFLFGLNFDF